MRITKRAVDAAQPSEKRYMLWDEGVRGFGLRVAPLNKKSGQAKKTYVLKCRIMTGEQRWLDIGPHGSPWTPEMARQEAIRLLRDIAAGCNPANEKQIAKAMPTMAELCDIYLAEGVAQRSRSRSKPTGRGLSITSRS
jgi:hypothetical protein